jgi:hypothetical protein
MLQFLTSWPVLLAVAAPLVAFGLLIEPAIPARPVGQFAELPSLTF